MAQNIKLGFEENSTSIVIYNSIVTTVTIESDNQLNYKTPSDCIKIFIFNGQIETVRVEFTKHWLLRKVIIQLRNNHDINMLAVGRCSRVMSVHAS